MKKVNISIVSMAIIVAAFISMPTIALAADEPDILQITNQLERADYGREVTFSPMTTEIDAAFENRELIHFDSVREFESFMQDFIAWLDEAESPESVENKLSETDSLTRSAINDKVTWWAPALGDILAWKNISFSYTLGNYSNGVKYLDDVSVTNSWVNHLAIALTWNHEYGNATDIGFISNVSGGRGYCNLSATGYWLIGIDIAGFEAGVAVNSTWEHDMTVEW